MVVYRRGDCFSWRVGFVPATDDVDCLVCLHRVVGFAAIRIGEPLTDVMFAFFESVTEPGLKVFDHVFGLAFEEAAKWVLFGK
jgi:hypothetical protein